MSVLFPKVNRPPKWEWRPIYYDPKKDEMDRKLRALQEQRAAEAKKTGEKDAAPSADPIHVSTLHRGSFREAREDSMSIRQRANRQSKLVLWLVVLGMLLFACYLLR